MSHSLRSRSFAGGGGVVARAQEGRICQLRREVARLENRFPRASQELISSGCAGLDRLLPQGGLFPGRIVEWVSRDWGDGAGWLSWQMAASALRWGKQRGRGRVVVIDTEGWFYPAVALAAGIAAEELMVLRPANRSDGIWAADQALRSRAVAAVWGSFPVDVLEERHARRLQLASEDGGALGLWMFPEKMLSQPCWGEVRLAVRGLPLVDQGAGTSSAVRRLEGRRLEARRLEVRMVRCRGGHPGQRIVLRIDSQGEIHDDRSSFHGGTSAGPLAAQLAHPAAVRGPREQRERA